jgi:type IV secretory pathway VirJ component
MVAIFLSGDGGWRDIDRQIGEALSRSGVSVVGVDALRYFWRERTPEETARDLERLIAYYTARWARPKVLLIGYSFGADVLPFAVNRLPPQVRRQVQLISLLGFATVADFEIRIAGWLGGHGDSALPTLPEIHRIDGTKIQCIYGDEEDDTGCTAPELAQADRLKMPGGHHFGGDYETVTRAILKAARFS